MDKTTGTPALTNLDTADVLELSSEEDLKYLAAIGLRALVAYEAVGDDELDGGDYQQAVA